MGGIGIHVFDSTIQESNLWIKAVMERLGTYDAHRAHLVLRATLHAVRDRIGPENAVHFGAQLPVLIRGLYYEGWHMAGTPTKERHMEQFVEHVRWTFPRDLDQDPEAAARAVFDVLWQKIDPGEIAKLVRIFPAELRELWPSIVQINAEEE